MKNDDMEKQASEQLADIAGEFVKQNRSSKRWRRFFILIFVVYFGVLIYLGVSETGILGETLKKEQPFVAELSLSGEVSQDGDINYDDTVDLLESAFSEPNAKAIILRLNSPGGSPVQAHKIYTAINRLSKHYNKKLYVAIEDVCASACYLIASAADKIYADESSIVGSIGVVISSFGATKAIEKLGISRRLYTAGKYKGMLDPFSSEDKSVNQHIQREVLQKSHALFIDYIKQGRGDRLKTDTPDLFSGLIWLGVKSKEIGLIDELGDAYLIANKEIGIKTRILFEQEKTLLEELTQASASGVSQQVLNWLGVNTGIR